MLIFKNKITYKIIKAVAAVFIAVVVTLLPSFSRIKTIIIKNFKVLLLNVCKKV